MKTGIKINKELLTITHQPLLDPIMKCLGVNLSEYCFPNLYFFRETHQYNILSDGEDLCLSGISYDKKRYLMPLVNLESRETYRQKLIEWGRDGGYDILFPIPESWVPLFEEENFLAEYREEDSDYLYASEKMQHYPGRKLHKKRNLLKQFVQNCEAEIHPLTDRNIQEPLRLLDIWQAASTQEMGDSDYYQCREALVNREHFNLQGAVFYADGNAVGFMIGEAVNDEVFAIHFAKGDTGVKGIYQYMFNSFALEFCRDYRYINLEQDLGIEGLRKTKRSYQPDLMAHKYRIHLK